MIKVISILQTTLLSGLLCMICTLGPTTHAYSAPLLTIEPQTTSTTSTTYNIILTNDGDIFNLVEFDLQFASSTDITTGTIESALCKPAFTISNTGTTTPGSWYVACGTFTPYSGTSTTLATFTVTNTSTTPLFSFGTKTALYRHDGLGTIVIPDTQSLVADTTKAQRTT
jgi:hypothetical protein